MTTKQNNKQALIVGATGIVGYNLADHLANKGWNVTGLSRNKTTSKKGFTQITADLLDEHELTSALKDINPTHVFFATWSRNDNEAENIRVNGTMMRNLLAAIRPQKSIQHFALVTGLKHYIGPFEMYAQVAPPLTPFKETIPRLDIPNFYYTLEDEVFAAAHTDGFTWSVHRPHTMIGFAQRNVMNMGATIGVYAAYCKETGHPFTFPGNELQWNGITDVTDAILLAEHLEWAAITEAAHNQALHVVNGDVFRWKNLWFQLADWFGIEAIGFSGTPNPLQEQMKDAKPEWEKIAQKYNLAESNLDKIASLWHTDADLLRPFECITYMSKSRELGFTGYRTTENVFLTLFEKLKAERLIP
jgi:nucleoside-diphosphate-sugar epimerase